MHLGVLLDHLDPAVDPLTISAAARSADQLGYHSVWAVDPLLSPRDLRSDGAIGLDPVSAIRHAARSTEHVGLGVHVPLAAAASVLADAGLAADAAGRLHVAIDVAPDSSSHDLAVLHGLARPPGRLLVSSADAGAAARAAAHADGWFAVRRHLEAIRTTWASLTSSLAHLRLVVRADIELSERPLSRHRSAFCGSIDQVVDDLVAVGAIGADAVVLAFAGEHGLDELLGGYAAIAEGLELRSPA